MRILTDKHFLIFNMQLDCRQILGSTLLGEIYNYINMSDETTLPIDETALPVDETTDTPVEEIVAPTEETEEVAV